MHAAGPRSSDCRMAVRSDARGPYADGMRCRPIAADVAVVPTAAPRPQLRACSARAQRRFVLVAAILASALGFIDGSVVSHRHAGDPRRSRRDPCRGAVDLQRLCADAVGADPAGGAAGDALRPAPRLRRRHRAVRRRLARPARSRPTPGILIAARAVQGIGAAIMVPGSLAIIAKAYPKSERGRAIGIWAAVVGADHRARAGARRAGAVGLRRAASGALIFAINLPLGGVAALSAAVRKVPADRPAKRARLDLAARRWRRWRFGALAYGLTASRAAAASGRCAGAAIVGAGVRAARASSSLWERRAARADGQSRRCFASRAFAGANVATFLLYFALSARSCSTCRCC